MRSSRQSYIHGSTQYDLQSTQAPDPALTHTWRLILCSRNSATQRFQNRSLFKESMNCTITERILRQEVLSLSSLNSLEYLSFD